MARSWLPWTFAGIVMVLVVVVYFGLLHASETPSVSVTDVDFGFAFGKPQTTVGLKLHYPEKMTEGDAYLARLFFGYGGAQPDPGVRVSARLLSRGSCDSEDINNIEQGLPPASSPSQYAWTVVAKSAGDCVIVAEFFVRKNGRLLDSNYQPRPIHINERVDWEARMRPYAAAIIGLLGTVLGMVGTAAITQRRD